MSFFVSSSNTFKKYCAGLRKDSIFFPNKSKVMKLIWDQGSKTQRTFPTCINEVFKEITAPLHSFVRILAL